MLQSKFRTNAIRRLTPEENYNEMFALIPRRSWLGLAAIALILAAALAWAVFGTIKRELPAQGVVSSQLGTTTVSALWSGEALEYFPQPGDTVAAGQMLMSIMPEEYAIRIENLEAQLALLQENEPGSNDQQARLEKELAALKQTAKPYSIITSPAAAEVVSYLVEPGDFVRQGDELTHLALRNEQMPGQKDVLLFIPAMDAGDVRPGQTVTFTVSAAGGGELPAKYSGEVLSVSRYPLQPDEADKLISSDSQREALRSSPMHMVRCQAASPLQAAGVSEQAGAAGLDYPSGTTVYAAIVVEQRRPISLLIP